MKKLADMSVSCKVEPGSFLHLQKLVKLTDASTSCSNELCSEDFFVIKR
eukprot:jgi/Antlo1/723/513